jgi:hypothetical protein
LFKRKINVKFLLASLKTLTNYKLVLKAASSVPAFLRSHWSIFANVHSWQAFGTAFRVTGGFRKAGKSSLKRVTAIILTICK